MLTGTVPPPRRRPLPRSFWVTLGILGLALLVGIVLAIASASHAFDGFAADEAADVEASPPSR